MFQERSQKNPKTKQNQLKAKCFMKKADFYSSVLMLRVVEIQPRPWKKILYNTHNTYINDVCNTFKYLNDCVFGNE